MVGAPGTFIVFDGARLLHRGGMVRSGERIALQVIFSSATKTSRVLGKIKRVIRMRGWALAGTARPGQALPRAESA
jgi:hypothetical protein